MKLLLVTVALIVVFSVDGQDFFKGNKDHPTNEDIGYQSEEKEGLNFLDGTNPLPVHEDLSEHNAERDFQDASVSNSLAKIIASPHDNLQLMEVEQENQKGKMRRSRCKARNSCVVMGGFCVTNATLCSGRLVPDGCKRPGCQCCVPGTIEARFDMLEIELQAIKESMNNSDLNLNTELQYLKNNMANSSSKIESIKDNVNNSNTYLNSGIMSLNSELQLIKEHMNMSDSNLGSELQSLKDNTSNMNSNLNTKLNSMDSNINTKLVSIAENQGCPKGFIKSADQCFKLFKDTSRTWDASKSKCQSEGLVMPKPLDPVQLRSYLIMRHGTFNAWLGARGTGSNVAWDQDGIIIHKSWNHLWYSGQPGTRTSTAHCLWFMCHEDYLRDHPTKPYYMQSCTHRYYTLCEYIKE